VLPVLNVAFFVFHSALILFNVFGWIWKATRRWNLVTLVLTLLSWMAMGIWFGTGYCICTDLHWKVRAAMGIHDHASSYLVLLVRILTGWDPPVVLVNRVAGAVFLAALSISLFLNIRDARSRQRAPVNLR
jgi:hypothetical protein